MYCFALASIFIFINHLGFDSLLQKKFADKENNINQILSEAFILRLFAAIFCIALVNLFGFFVVDEKYHQILFLISLYHLYLPYTTFEWYFQAQGRADLAAFALIFGQIVSFAYRILAVFIFNDLMLLSLGYLIEFMVPALFYIYILNKHKINVFLNFKKYQYLPNN